MDICNVMTESKQPNLVYTFILLRGILKDSHVNLQLLRGKENLTYENVNEIIKPSHRGAMDVRNLHEDFVTCVNGEKTATDLSIITFLRGKRDEAKTQQDKAAKISPPALPVDVVTEFAAMFVAKSQTLLEELEKVYSMETSLYN